MIKLFWMLYLAFAIFVTFSAIRIVLLEAFTEDCDAEHLMEIVIIASLTWAIWYMYYLN